MLMLPYTGNCNFQKLLRCHHGKKIETWLDGVPARFVDIKNRKNIQSF